MILNMIIKSKLPEESFVLPGLEVVVVGEGEVGRLRGAPAGHLREPGQVKGQRQLSRNSPVCKREILIIIVE